MTRARIGTWLGVIALVALSVSIWRDVTRSGASKDASPPTESTPAQPPKPKVDFGTGGMPSGAGAPAADAATDTPGKMQAALRDAGRQKKHLFALFVRSGDSQSEEMKGAFAEAGRSLGNRAMFRVADVGDRSEGAFVKKYGIASASLPLTLVFAPNGAVVKAFAGKVVTESDLSRAFASPAYAEVMKAMQGQKLVLLCAQGKRTRHNAESLSAARAVATDKKAGSSIAVVSAAPEDAANAALFRPLEATSALKEATVYILVPPATLAGKVAGATTREALWGAISKAVSSCSSGSCGPGGCGG